MADSKPKRIEVQYQLSDDLYFCSFSQEEMEKLFNKRSYRGVCCSDVQPDGVRERIICVRDDLDTSEFCYVFYHEFCHYCVDRILSELLGSKLTDPISPFVIYISEMLCNEICWDCKLFGTTTCWLYPNELLRRAYEGTADLSSLDKKTLENLLKQQILLLEYCLLFKMDEESHDDSSDPSSSIYDQLQGVLEHVYDRICMCV